MKDTQIIELFSGVWFYIHFWLLTYLQGTLISSSLIFRKDFSAGGAFCVQQTIYTQGLSHFVSPLRRPRSRGRDFCQVLLGMGGCMLAFFYVALALGSSVYASELAGLLPPPGGSAGVFSWSAEVVNQTDGEIFSVMKARGATALYQHFSTKNSRQEQMSLFAERAMAEGVTVYHLTGDPSWGLDPEGVRLCEAVEEAASFNRWIARKFLERREADGASWEAVPRLAGIVLDVEPYTLDQWDENPGGVMDSYVSGMKRAYALAQEYDLEVIACVPWHYDNKGLEAGLEELIQYGCDSVAVMNYYRGSEVQNIATEAALARKHGKGLITIYELQKADGRGILEVNTYYQSGLKALEESYISVKQAYPDQPVSIAYHDYKALREVLNR